MKVRRERVRDIYDEIVEQTGTCWPNTHRIAGYMGVKDQKAKEILKGVPAMKDGRQTKYRAKAVAERLADLEARGCV